MYLGATTWTFSWAPPYDDALKTIAKLGFKGAELTIWSEEFLQDYYTPETNKQLRSLIADLGLVLASVFCIPVGIGSVDPKQRADAVDQFKRVLDAAEQLGTDKVIALPPNPLTLIFRCCWARQPHRSGASNSLKELTGNGTGLTWSMYCGNLLKPAMKERCALRWNRIRTE